MHWLDALYLKLTTRQPLFTRGWGDVERPLDEVPALLTRSVPRPLALDFMPTSPRIDEAFVASPAPLLDAQLAPLHVVRLRARGPTRARLIVPPSWGDEGFWLRRHLVDSLRSRGVEVWLFEGAYFGSRRAAGQVKVGLHTVGDFLRMQAGYTLEGHAGLIKCPTLVVDCEGDFASQSDMLYAALTCEKKLLKLSADSGAGGHCAGMGQQVWAGAVFPWIADTLAWRR